LGLIIGSRTVPVVMRNCAGLTSVLGPRSCRSVPCGRCYQARYAQRSGSLLCGNVAARRRVDPTDRGGNPAPWKRSFGTHIVPPGPGVFASAVMSGIRCPHAAITKPLIHPLRLRVCRRQTPLFTAAASTPTVRRHGIGSEWYMQIGPMIRAVNRVRGVSVTLRFEI